MTDTSNHLAVKNFQIEESPIQRLEDPLLDTKKIELHVKRDDLLHPEVSGNKWRKLKYNLHSVFSNQLKGIITFGGAFSNHIYSTAAACHLAGIDAIGFIRGEENIPLNSTLAFASDKGMTLNYLSREKYRDKSDPTFLKNLETQYPDYLIVPEGGANHLGLKGCQELGLQLQSEADIICCAVGTGNTLAGIINGLQQNQRAIGISVLKNGGFLNHDIENWLNTTTCPWQLELNYHFGGYAKIQKELVSFMDEFEMKYNIPLEPIYTAKLFFGLFDLIKKDYFPRGTKIVAVHTGGLQGLAGMATKLASYRHD